MFNTNKKLEEEINCLNDKINNPIVGYYFGSIYGWQPILKKSLVGYHVDNSMVEIKVSNNMFPSFWIKTKYIIWTNPKYSIEFRKKQEEIEQLYIKNEKNNKRNRS